jgi:hypothetical protein
MPDFIAWCDEFHGSLYCAIFMSVFRIYLAYADCGLLVQIYLLCSENFALRLQPVWAT